MSTILHHVAGKVHIQARHVAKAEALPPGGASTTVGSQNDPFSVYTSLAKIDRSDGLEAGETYLIDSANLAHIRAIAHNERDKTLELLENVKCFSFIIDGITVRSR